MKKQILLITSLIFLCTIGLRSQTFKNIENNKNNENFGIEIIESDITPIQKIIKNPLSTKEVETVQIGGLSGYSTGSLPLNDGCSYSQQLYFQDEIDVEGKRIKSLSFYYIGDSVWSDKIEVYMAHVDSTRLRAWVPAHDLSRVFSGTFQIDSTPGWVKINLTHPFEYNNEQNLVIAVVDNQDNHIPTSYVHHSYFAETLTNGEDWLGPILALGVSATGPITVENPVFDGRWRAWRNDIQLEFEDIPAKPMLYFYPEVFDVPYFSDFGAVMTGSENIKMIKIKNIGNQSVTIQGGVFSENADAFTFPSEDIVIGINETIEIPIQFNPTQVGEYDITLQLNTDIDCEGDLSYGIKASVYQRGYLWEGFEYDNTEFPNNFWDCTSGNTPFPESVPYNWYINNSSNYPQTYCYERYGLIQNWSSSAIDTLMTPQLEIAAGDSLVFHMYGMFTGGRPLPLIYSHDKENWFELETVYTEEFELLQEDPRAKYTRYVIDLTAAEGDSYIGFISGQDNYHIDQLEGPKLALKDNDLMISDFTGPVSLSAENDNIFKVSVLNKGYNNQTTFDIVLMQDGETPTELVRITGTEINFFDEAEYEVVWVPETEGEFNIYAEIDFSSDEDLENNTSESISAIIYNSTTIGQTLGTENNENLFFYPLNFNFEVTLGQVIYHADELQVGESELHEIHMYMNMTHDIYEKGIKIWVGETELEDLQDGFIPASQLTLVYENEAENFYAGDHLLRIPFNEPYSYTGNNLVVMIQRTMDDDYYTWEHRFYVSENPAHKKRGLFFYDRMFDIDPYNPPSMDWLGGELPMMQLTNTYPDATFFFDVDGLGEIRGTVMDESDNPLEKAFIYTNNSYFSTYTDESGNYSMPYMNPGATDITASKSGLYDETQSASVVANNYQVLDFNLGERAQINLSGKIINHNNVPVEGANIYAVGYHETETLTNSLGEFSVQLWSDAVYEIYISKYGYENDTISFEVGMNDSTLTDIVLTEIPAFPGMLTATIIDENAELAWSQPDPATAKEFRFDSGIVSQQIGYNNTDRSIIGTAYRNKALITEISYYFTEYKTSDKVEIFIYGLDELGRPDKNQFIYKSRVIDCEIEQWNTYTLDVGIYAENGFFVALSAAGYLSLGTSPSSPEYPFQQETYFGNFNVDDSTSYGTVYPLDIDGIYENLMLRVNGYDFGALEFEYDKHAQLIYNVNNDHKLNIINNEIEIESGNPVYKYNLKSVNDKNLEDYILYRFPQESLSNTAEWTIVAENLADTSYTDSNWPDLEKGVYYYAVEAIYDSGLPSYKRKSNPVRKDLNSDVTINITLPENITYGDIKLRLENADKYLNIKHVITGINTSNIEFTNLWQGDYFIEVSHPNCVNYIEQYSFENATETIEIELEDATFAPENLQIVSDGGNGGDLTWEDPEISQIAYDDESFETGYFFMPGTYGEFGNLFNTDDEMILTSVNVYGVEHNWGTYGQTVKVKVYNMFKEFIGESDTLELPASNWTEVSLPNIKVDNFFYVMVSWDYLLKPTNTLGLDTNGVEAITKTPAVVKDNLMNFVEFGLAGGYSGAFMVRPNGYLTGEKSLSTSGNVVNNDVPGEVDKYNAIDVSGKAAFVQEKSKAKNVGYNIYLNNFSSALAQVSENEPYNFNDLSAGSNSAGVSVLYNYAESSIATIDFEFPFASTDATLASIQIDGENLDGFDPHEFVYIYNLPSGYIGLPGVDVTTTHANATAEVTYDNANNFVYINVIAEDNVTTFEYSIYFNHVGVQNLSSLNINVYPNPASEGIYIDNANGLTVKITNLVGQTLSKKVINTDKEYIELSQLNNGTYLIQIIHPNGEFVVKYLNIIQ